MTRLRILATVTVLLLAGCNCGRENPSFPVTYKDAKAELARMSEDPQPLQRPLVCINGWRDVGATRFFEKHFSKHVDDDRVLIVRVDNTSDMEKGREKVLEAVEERFPSDDPQWSVPVDVIGFSMGGLIARYAADPGTGDRHLRIVRLFSVSAPHQGANSVAIPLPGPRLQDMRKGSKFLTHLNEEVSIDYELIPYTRLCDITVGAKNTFPPGYTPWWVSARAFQSAHIHAIRDPRIMLDITRQLCGEPPVTVAPATPLP